MMRGIGKLSVLGMGIDVLAGWLSPDAGRMVVNKTGLEGIFDWDLTYTPDQLRHHPLVAFNRSILRVHPFSRPCRNNSGSSSSRRRAWATCSSSTTSSSRHRISRELTSR